MPNPNIISALVKSSYVTNPPNYNDYMSDQEPIIGVGLRKLTELASPTLVEPLKIIIVIQNLH